MTMTETNGHDSTRGTDDDMVFRVLKSGLGGGPGSARLGRLTLPNRPVVETPNFITATSRGSVPHVTPDHITQHLAVGGAYLALEDCKFFSVFVSLTPSPVIEKKVDRHDVPPLFKMPCPHPGLPPRPLHDFTALPRSLPTVLGPRRCQPVTTPGSNTDQDIAIWTSTGGSALPVDSYADVVETVKPDVAIAPADLFHTAKTPGAKRMRRQAERTEDWNVRFFRNGTRERLKRAEVAVFAPILAVPYPVQWQYVEHLADGEQEAPGALAGLAFYGVKELRDVVENHPSLRQLARLSLDIPASPHEVLRQVAAGVDLCTVPFLNGASDAGVALTFQFPPMSQETDPTHQRALGLNMWSPEHVTSLAPLADDCSCYTCKRHHRAFVHHLLNAKEMLGWTLLQIHNHRVATDFFAGVRKALADGGPDGTAFAEHARRFGDAYEPELPQGTGARPRARGYNFKSEAGQERMNAAAWENYAAQPVSAAVAAGDAVASPLAATAAPGWTEEGTETPVIPDVGSLELDRKGFAEVQTNGNGNPPCE